MPKKKTEDLDIYKGYRSGQYRHFRMVDSGKRETIIRRGKPVVRKVLEKAEIPFEEIRQINLDNIGVIMPTPTSGHYVQLQNYLVDYWVGVLGAGAYTVYTKLLRHCYGTGNLCFKNIEIMCSQLGMTRPTFNNHIEKLEQYGFVIRFWREDKEGNSRESSPLFLVRKTVPKLPQEILDTFDEELLEEHDNSLAEFDEMTIITGRDKVNYVEKVLEDKELVKEGRHKHNPEESSIIQDTLLQMLSDKQLEIHNKIHNHLMTKIAKPTYDTFLHDIVFVHDNEVSTLIVICGNDYSYDYVSVTEKFHAEILKVLNEEMLIDARLTFTTPIRYLNKKEEA